jgi:hypothetical protein
MCTVSIPITYNTHTHTRIYMTQTLVRSDAEKKRIRTSCRWFDILSLWGLRACGKVRLHFLICMFLFILSAGCRVSFFCLDVSSRSAQIGGISDIYARGFRPYHLDPSDFRAGTRLLTQSVHSVP